MEILIRQASLEDTNNINHLLRLSKGHWGYSEEFLDSFMKGFSITAQYIQKYDIRLFYIDNIMVGFFNFIINKNNIL